MLMRTRNLRKVRKCRRQPLGVRRVAALRLPVDHGAARLLAEDRPRFAMTPPAVMAEKRAFGCSFTPTLFSKSGSINQCGHSAKMRRCSSDALNMRPAFECPKVCKV